MKQEKNKRPMTPAMKRLLEFVRKYYTNYGFYPTFQFMADKMGYKSKNSITQLVEKLEQRGDLIRMPGYRRNIKLNDKS
jgi:SOS-response transcriptional repressor LexA|tara:strand:+ start:3244 stop:3480 length:237 start_codon:yes stop_codon:yes gene_type:complete